MTARFRDISYGERYLAATNDDDLIICLYRLRPRIVYVQLS
jgi:hypothetical protein